MTDLVVLVLACLIILLTRLRFGEVLGVVLVPAISIFFAREWTVILCAESSDLVVDVVVDSVDSTDCSVGLVSIGAETLAGVSTATFLPVTITWVLESTSSSTGRFLERMRTEIFSGSPGFGKSWSATVLMSVSISPSSILITRVA